MAARSNAPRCEISTIRVIPRGALVLTTLQATWRNVGADAMRYLQLGEPYEASDSAVDRGNSCVQFWIVDLSSFHSSSA